jgi:hypothetical protein
MPHNRECLTIGHELSDGVTDREAIRRIADALRDSGEVADEGFILRLAEIAAEAVGLGLPPGFAIPEKIERGTTPSE